MTECVAVEPARENSPERVQFRHDALTFETEMQGQIDAGTLVKGEYPLKHYFAPLDQRFGCYVYAREIFMPKGHVVIGKIHKHAHLAFILKGKISVITEFGKQYYEAPCTFISEAGVKRIAYIEEDTTWTTVHLTEQCGEDHLDEIEDTVIAKTYEELGLLASPQRLASTLGQKGMGG